MASSSMLIPEKRKPYENIAADNNNQNYKCCCGCLHVGTGAVIIGILELVGVMVNGAGIILNYKSGDFGTNTKKLVGGLTGAVATIVVVMLMFHGMWKEKPRFVVPHLVFQAIGIAALFVGGVVALVEFLEGKQAAVTMATAPSSGLDDDSVAMVTSSVFTTTVNKTADFEVNFMPGESFLIYTIATIVVLVASSVLEIWFFSVIYRFYGFLKEKQIRQLEADKQQQQQLFEQLKDKEYENLVDI